MSMRHQLWMCWKQLGILGKPSENYLYAGDIVSYPNEIDLSDLPDEIQNYIREANMHTMKIFESRDVMIKGHCYRPGCVLALDYVDFWPSYGVVDRILVIDYQKFFLSTKLDVIEFDNHIGSYVVRRSEIKKLLKYQTLKYVWPLSMHIYNGSTVIMDKYRFFSEI